MRYIAIIVLFTLLICTGCGSSVSDEECATYDYSGCETTEPVAANLNVHVTLNSENPYVPLQIYRGRVEDSVLVMLDTARKEEVQLLMATGSYYSVAARYISGNKIIYALGGDKVSTSSERTCDSICWSVSEGNVNVELKY